MNYRKEHSPDALLPSSNEFDIPDLPLRFAAKYLDRGLVRWGRLNKSSLRHAKAIHFYTNDSAFGSLTANPHLLLGTDCVTAIEVNFSLGPQTQMAWAIWKTAQKRTFSYLWGNAGVGIIVDLSVHPRFRDLNLMGVPLGWSAFACRGYQGFSVDDIYNLYLLACSWSGHDHPLFVVYGGGRKVSALCRDHGFIYVPEDSHVYEKRKSHEV